MYLIKRFADLFLGFLGLRTQSAQTDIEICSEVEAPKKKRKRKKRDVDYVDGNYLSIKDLLEDMENWTEALSKFRTSSSDMDRLIKRLGIFVSGREDYLQYDSVALDVAPLYFATTFHSGHLKRHFDKTMDKDNPSVPILIYANRMKHNHLCNFIERPRSGWLYDVWIGYYVDGEWYKTNTFAALEDGRFRLLSFQQQINAQLPKPKRRTGEYSTGKRGETFTKVTWVKRPLMVSERKATVEDTEAYITMAFNRYLRRGAGTEIHATKGGCRLVFTVPEHRWKDFFKDRITAKASDGRRKRIFHHVAAHTRSNGSYVPMHTRGETEFSWEGHSVRIVEQKKGRVSVLDLEVSSESTDDLVTPTNSWGPDQAAAKILESSLRRLHRSGGRCRA